MLKKLFDKLVVWLFYLIFTVIAIGIAGFLFWLDKVRFVF